MNKDTEQNQGQKRKERTERKERKDRKGENHCRFDLQTTTVYRYNLI